MAEAAVLLRLARLGHLASKPLNPSRYDYVIDSGQGLERAQVKNGLLRDGCIVFNTASSYWHSRKEGQLRRRSYRGQIDCFMVYCAELDKVYRVPVDHVGESRGYLRVVAARNGQAKGVRSAEDYEIG